MIKTLAVLAFIVSGAVAQSTTRDAVPPWNTGVNTEDGTCGAGTPGWVCNPVWGACCGKDSTCGRSSAYCGAGCQVGYGNCNAPAVPSSTPTPTPAPGPGSPSPDGSCAGTQQYNCTGATYGDCCSSSGWCGSTPAHCGAGCQALFGKCPDSDDTVSTDGRCGPTGGYQTCPGSGFGICCSVAGFCGSTDAHCTGGCQHDFGTCSEGGNPNVSIDGKCGANGKSCRGSSFGDCCSSSGFCGGTSEFCGAGCQTGFGTCTSTDNISIDGKCATNGKTCKGSAFGNCCSSSGFCGSTSAFCSAGCQSSFGTCTTADNVSVDGACGKNGKTCKGSAFGDCCSASGFCGKTAAFCDAGCQAAFGTCNAGAGAISTDGSCGKNGKTCAGSTFGNCCSGGGFCGSTANHCGQNCQSGFSSGCLTTNIPSVDGSCGVNKGKITCNGGDFNNQCCSAGGFCGTTTGHCGTGCQKGYGRCT